MCRCLASDGYVYDEDWLSFCKDIAQASQVSLFAYIVQNMLLVELSAALQVERKGVWT